MNDIMIPVSVLSILGAIETLGLVPALSGRLLQRELYVAADVH
jgi:hypothetical protein